MSALVPSAKTTAATATRVSARITKEERAAATVKITRVGAVVSATCFIHVRIRADVLKTNAKRFRSVCFPLNPVYGNDSGDAVTVTIHVTRLAMWFRIEARPSEKNDIKFE